MYIISASIEFEGEGVTCFDPTKVINQLSIEIPEIIVCLEDYGWRDYDVFKRMGTYEGAIRVAENDARRRAPVFIFRISNSKGQITKGQVERYYIGIRSDEKIPDETKNKLLSFFEKLKINKIKIKSRRLEGNDEFPE